MKPLASLDARAIHSVLFDIDETLTTEGKLTGKALAATISNPSFLAIHPNANLPADKAGAPEAVFEIAVDGVAKDAQWTQGMAAPPELSSFGIFDSRCARAYLDSEDDFSYVPYGLDVFERLAKVCKQLKTSIDTEHAQSAADLTAFAPLQGDTLVGKMVASLSAKTRRPRSMRWPR